MVCVLFSLGSQQPRQSDSGSVWQMSSNTRAHSGEEAPKLKVKSRSTENAGLSREEVNLVTTTCVARLGLAGAQKGVKYWRGTHLVGLKVW